MSIISARGTCYLCGGYLHVDGDLLLVDVMIVRKGTEPRHIEPVHPWCKRQRLDEYESKANDQQAVFARKPRG